MTTSSKFSWVAEVDRVERDRYEPDDAYQFSNARIFKSTDKSHGGIYFPYLGGGLTIPFILQPEPDSE